LGYSFLRRLPHCLLYRSDKFPLPPEELVGEADHAPVRDGKLARGEHARDRFVFAAFAEEHGAEIVAAGRSG